MPKNLKTLLKGKTVVFGIGNRLRGDDGIGPELIGRIGSKIDAVCINGENAPEMYLGKITKESPDTILVIDAVHIGRKAGEFQILSLEELSVPFFTTHDLPLRFLLERLRTLTNSRIYIVGVQPQRVSFGESFSRSAQKALRTLERLLMEALPKGKKDHE
jgi:hydrogenase maturation protease HycI